MKTNQIIRVVSIALLLGLMVGITGCSNLLHNENDWAFKKGASPVFIPLEVSR